MEHSQRMTAVWGRISCHPCICIVGSVNPPLSCVVIPYLPEEVWPNDIIVYLCVVSLKPLASPQDMMSADFEGNEYTCLCLPPDLELQSVQHNYMKEWVNNLSK